MAFFRRRPRRARSTAGHGPVDAALSPLSAADADVVVSWAVEAFRAAGVPTAYDGAGALVASDGRTFGLTNLAALLGRLRRSHWRRAVRRHVRTIVVAQSLVPPRTLDEIREIVLPRLVPTGELSTEPARPPSYAPTAGPDLAVLAALDYPTHVATMSADDALEPFGGWAAVRPYAEANLRRLPPPEHRAVDADPGRPDAVVHVFASDDFHGASRLLLLDEVLATHVGVESPAHGVLFAVPHRHLLAAHVVEGTGVLRAVGLLARLARSEHADAPGPVSPHVYYKGPDGVVETVTRTGDEGEVVVDSTGSLGTALRAVGVFD
ncbi:hypothetical protein [Oerskovia flava]|uniref:hypothetical protein n=1 Tax=Oerskovia flava TaxID=2986422 RepID=UPI00223EF64B|nr:hypothetical protein [Oerskovia sp. JB1-3-2]